MMKLTWLTCVFIVLINLKLIESKITSLGFFDINPQNGSVNKVNGYVIKARMELVILFEPRPTNNPFKIKTWSTNCSEDLPILVVVRQETQVNSWQVPVMLEASDKETSLKFYNTSKIMCPDNMDSITRPEFSAGPAVLSQVFIVGLSTSSPKPVDVYVEVMEETDFYVKRNQIYSLLISPSEPMYYYYAFDKNSSDTVVVDINSEDDICLTVSVQDSKCPVLDTNKDITYEGNYQTINRKGAITIRKNDFKYGFFLVFVAKADNYDCSQHNSVLPMPRTINVIPGNRTSAVSFQITNSIYYKDYMIASLGTLLVFFVFCLVSTVMVFVFNRWGTISQYKTYETEEDSDRDSIDQAGPISVPQIDYLLKSEHLTVKSLAKYPKKDKRRSFNYLWHILSIALFYSIPVVQLVVTYQRVVNQTGDQDMCYYNFLCAHPSFGLSDFNHIYSNIGYVITGILFIFVIINRHAKIKIRFEIGIPVHYGLFYSMGVALIIEGILSACYHICPSQSNYQFDTSFMYVMAVLCMVKLYQNRHPDINATAYATFTVLGAAIFLAMLGILNGNLALWIGFVIAYSLLCIYISFKIYFLSFVLEGFKNLKEDFQEQGLKSDIVAPTKRSRFILLVIANVANYAMLITGLCLYNSEVTDFGTFLLGLLMGNAVIHAIFYTCMKLIYHERICMEAICYGLLGIAFWAAATVFFLDGSTLWTVTPAESRQWNQGCVVMNFYDKHDVWHLLSAPALYFSFMFLLCLDDDLINKRQAEIPVF